MKLSSNTVGMLIFFALATAVFVLMVLRPAVEGNAINFGVPLMSEAVATKTSNESTSVANESATAEVKTETETVNAETKEEVAPATEAVVKDDAAMEATEEKAVTEEAPVENPEPSTENKPTN